MEVYSEEFVHSLEEAIELLQEDNSRHRRALKIQRMINSALRRKLLTAHNNDEEFKEFCQSDIVVDVDE